MTVRSRFVRFASAIAIVGALLATAVLLAPTADAQEGTRSKGKADPIGVCIDSELVQGTRGARNLGFGDVFTKARVKYVIMEDSPSCTTFNCHDGFDMNCDGKLGDYCSIELDRSTVAGVKACLEELAEREESVGGIS